MTPPEPAGWSLTEDDRDLLHSLAYALRRLTDLAVTGADLIAIGEALQAVEILLEGGRPEVDVGLDIGYRAGDAGFSEGVFAGFRINARVVVLDVTRTTGASDIGSDSSTTRYAVLRPRGRFDEEGVQRWSNELDAILASGEPRCWRSATMFEDRQLPKDAVSGVLGTSARSRADPGEVIDRLRNASAANLTQRWQLEKT